MNTGEENDKYTKDRQGMVKRDLMGRGIGDSNVLKAMGEIPREEFVPPNLRSNAYYDGPLSIGMGQTISQPYIVALMTQELRAGADCEVLEIGTGCGYQTAILSKLVKKVYTIERFDQLAESAKRTLGKLGIHNVEFYVGDGSCGWPGRQLPCSGFFDRIIITAAAPELPGPLIEQLAEGGILVGPISYDGGQRLVACEKIKGRITKRTICDVRFVKLFGEYGYQQ